MYKRQIRNEICGQYQWQCDNGDCIDASDRCDGKPNCADGSDETVVNCISMACPTFAFRCMYGACVNGNAECNGIQDCVDNSDELSPKCPSRTLGSPQGVCQEYQYQCKNGNCIPSEHVCDGNSTCSDGSDETIERCASIKCPSYAFRCGYGGCVSGKSRCNRREDCLDGSDENYLLCNYTKPLVHATSRPVTGTPSTPINPGGCRITKLPKNGYVGYLSSPDQHLDLNDAIDNYIQVQYSCIDNHIVVGDATNFCDNGNWLHVVPECKPHCSANEIVSVTFVANCFLNINGTEQEVRCQEPSKPGTIARINCQRGYENVREAQQVISCSSDGRWHPAPNSCTQICGEEGPEGQPYIVGGIVTNITKVPWHVALYKRIGGPSGTFEQWCGGTILNAKTVISAMHCFWDRTEDKPFDNSEFRVVAGKFKRDFTAEEDLKTQTLSIERINYLDGYSDLAGLFASDIVIITLKSYIEFKTYIAPICIEYDLTYDERTVPPGWIGRVAGWGLEEANGLPSPQLKLIELPAVSRQECREKSNREFVPYITSDKFCAGFLTGVSVCQGDSGGGLAFSKVINQKNKYFIRGIVSTGANKAQSCDNDKYTTFTNTAFFTEFILRYEVDNRPT